MLPARCVPGGSYSLLARQEALTRLADGWTGQEAAPDCLDPHRIADPSTIRRWVRRRMESLGSAVNRVTTLFAWDWRAAARILIPEPNPL